MDPARVVIVGGGGTGGALAHDLALRGLRVTLLERAELTSGTTGRHHGLLHSGARYAVSDPESAVECIAENRILRRIAPGSFEENGGLFVALTDEDMDYRPGFVAACAASGIPARELTPAEALALEPGLNPALKAAVWVPDATMDAMRLPLRFFATRAAQRRPAAAVHRGHRPGEGRPAGDRGGRPRPPDRPRPAPGGRPGGERRPAPGAGGWPPWPGRPCPCGRRRGAAGRGRPALRPGRQPAAPGRRRRHRGAPAALSIVGTSAWTVDDPDDLDVPDEHVRAMYTGGGQAGPGGGHGPERAAWSAARPLVGAAGGGRRARELSRTFKCFDHAATDGVEGLVTITGGKATTLRAMAEATADLVCAKLGVDAPCRTREVVLAPHSAYYAGRAA